MIQYLWMLLYLMVFNSNSETTRVSFTRVESTHSVLDNKRVDSSSTVSATPLTFSTPGPYTLPYLRSNRKCRANATDFVYKNKLCDASDPETYSTSQKARYSCVHRCDEFMPYSEQGHDKCACDAACLVHNDCCRDMSLVCPKTYAQGIASYPNNLESFCPRFQYPSPFSTISSCPAEESLYLNRDLKTPTANKYASTDDEKIPFGSIYPWKINRFAKTFSPYKSVDVSTGLIFYRPKVFEICGSSKGIPYVIPIIVILDCPSKPFDTKVNDSTFHILQRCQKRISNNAVTPFHRSCRKFKFVYCKCSNGEEEEEEYFTDFLHNVCMGYSENVSHFNRYPVWNYQSIGEQKTYKDDPCSVSNIPSVEERLKPANLLIKMSISFLPFSYESLLRNTFGRGDNSDTVVEVYNKIIHGVLRKSFDKVYNDTIIKMLKMRENHYEPEQEKMMFVVEINSTDQRRFLCIPHQNDLAECQLLDCAHGNVLWHDPLRFGQFGNNRCLSPVDVVVRSTGGDGTVPVCFCLHVLGVLSGVGTWQVKMRLVGDGQCVLDLDLLPKGELNRALQSSSCNPLFLCSVALSNIKV
ncbi:hypothetical protein ElyMa_003711500 [Elysia marginata]|uniref:SMB domain-containing protein n=1 Tax=Elysia marginata TaxID=1093978 RepID=A0AAV4F4J5_9GAST|nr:hypothetical protein ElyMa_003711500 [Elysia marginata]